ncbi:hypothetical protein R3P38DRAFT_3172200 [Favolaschia claudopus]|uniref:Redoxin domain-containing protein n=1 Tax=Favolaschia claudopus TaxID=2862362 RepID=A0AAW0DJZ3_9AGAR
MPRLSQSTVQVACGVPSKLNTETEWKGKKVFLFSVPGAFTPTCHTNQGLGIRTGRYAMIIDDLVVKYIEVESDPRAVTVSGADAILGKL